MKNFLIAILILTPFLVFAPTSQAFERTATSGTGVREEIREQRKENVKENVNRRIEARCSVSEKRSAQIVGRYDEGYPVLVKNYRQMKERVQKLITNAKAAGKDTTKLEADLKVLDTKITELDTQVKAIVAQLNVAKSLPCGESEGEYKAAILKAREMIVKAHQMALDIRMYYQKTIKPDLLALKK